MLARLHIKYPLFLQDLNKTLIFSIDLKNTQNIKFHENSSSVGRAVPCGRIDRQTDTMLIVLFAIFRKPLKMGVEMLYPRWVPIYYLHGVTNHKTVNLTLFAATAWNSRKVSDTNKAKSYLVSCDNINYRPLNHVQVRQQGHVGQ